eukprot:g6675.t1
MGKMSTAKTKTTAAQEKPTPKQIDFDKDDADKKGPAQASPDLLSSPDTKSKDNQSPSPNKRPTGGATSTSGAEPAGSPNATRVNKNVTIPAGSPPTAVGVPMTTSPIITNQVDLATAAQSKDETFPSVSILAKHASSWSKVYISKGHAIKARDTPGPGSYMPALQPSESSVRFGTAVRKEISYETPSPGPVYDIRRSASDSNFGAGKFSLDDRWRGHTEFGATGPGQYNQEATFDGTKGMRKSFAVGHRAYDRVRFPGCDRVNLGRQSPGPGQFRHWQPGQRRCAFPRSQRKPLYDGGSVGASVGPGSYSIDSALRQTSYGFGKPSVRARIMPMAKTSSSASGAGTDGARSRHAGQAAATVPEPSQTEPEDSSQTNCSSTSCPEDSSLQKKALTRRRIFEANLNKQRQKPQRSACLAVGLVLALMVIVIVLDRLLPPAEKKPPPNFSKGGGGTCPSPAGPPSQQSH